jgi:hypothetical protein
MLVTKIVDIDMILSSCISGYRGKTAQITPETVAHATSASLNSVTHKKRSHEDADELIEMNIPAKLLKTSDASNGSRLASGIDDRRDVINVGA